MSDSEFALGASTKKRVRYPVSVPIAMDNEITVLATQGGVSKATMSRILIGEAIDARKRAGTFPGVSAPAAPPQAIAADPASESTSEATALEPTF